MFILGMSALRITSNLSFSDRFISIAWHHHTQLSVICCNALGRVANCSVHLLQMPSRVKVCVCFSFGKFWKEKKHDLEMCLFLDSAPCCCPENTFSLKLTSCCPLWCPEPIGSMSSMEVNVDMLEQMDLMDMSDHEALDVFLHSGGEDNSAASPVTGR